jgi:predicted HD phosphohydrolase
LRRRGTSDVPRDDESTKADWARIRAAKPGRQAGLADRVLVHLGLLGGDYGGFAVDRLTHSLQTATRACHDNRDDASVACALLHDIGDMLGSYSHADIGAATVKPFVSESYHWMLQNHNVFQGYHADRFCAS